MFVDVNVRERARSVGRSHAHGEGRGVLRGARPAGKIKFLRGQVSAVVGVLVSVSVSLALRCVCSEKGFQILSVGVNLQPPRMIKKYLLVQHHCRCCGSSFSGRKKPKHEAKPSNRPW